MRTVKNLLKKFISAYMDAMNQYGGEALCMSKGV